MGLFGRKRQNVFPTDMNGRRESIMRIHHDLAGDDNIVKPAAIDHLLDMVSDESDVCIMAAYAIYYIGFDKPFKTYNKETAKIIADGILANGRLKVPTTNNSNTLFNNCCSGEFSIDDIAEWLGKYAVKA